MNLDDTNEMDGSLVAYRLGRLEKAVDTINTNSMDRDDRILLKLETLDNIAKDIALHTMRLNSLESWRMSINKFLTGVVLALVAIILQIVLGR